MATTITNVKVETTYRYPEGERSSSPNYFVQLSIPIPGGNAIYEMQVEKEMYDNLELADQLARGKKK
jgi:hypothetical protein